MILAIDFDGTIVEDKYPQIGNFRTNAVEKIKLLKKEGYILILWTNRTGKKLAEAVKVCAESGIRFDAINCNLKSEIIKYEGSDPRKIGASLFIDDRGLTDIMPSWDEIYEMVHNKLPTYPDKVARDGML